MTNMSNMTITDETKRNLFEAAMTLLYSIIFIGLAFVYMWIF